MTPSTPKGFRLREGSVGQVVGLRWRKFSEEEPEIGLDVIAIGNLCTDVMSREIEGDQSYYTNNESQYCSPKDFLAWIYESELIEDYKDQDKK